MKNLIVTFVTIIAFMASATVLTSCGPGDQKNSDSTEQHDHDHDSIAAVDHSCPMHSEITGKEGDKCSKCGMFLTKTEENSDASDMKEHMHDMDTVAFNCPMHPDEKGVKGDKCSKCKMDLVASSDKMSMKICSHKDGKTCGMCSDKEGMKCDHKEGETCPNCKKA